jgi:hypothetical protein
MWIWLILFAIAFTYKLLKHEPVFVRRAYEYVHHYSSLFLAGVVFTTVLVYIRTNVNEHKWDWYKYISHGIIAAVTLTTSTFYKAHKISLSTVILVAAGFAFGHVGDAYISPWVDVTTLCILLGTVHERGNATLVMLATITGYAFFLFAHVPLDLTGIVLLIAFVRGITLIVANNAVHDIPWSILLAAYNVVQLVHIPSNTDEKIENQDVLLLTAVGVLLFMLQWTVVIWISNIGSISYVLGLLLIDMLFILASDIPTEALYLGWFCVFVVVMVYSNYPWNRTLPDREPSVPELPPESPKTKRENLKPSALLELPDPPSGVPDQGEIV